jgi:hypothetical protein
MDPKPIDIDAWRQKLFAAQASYQARPEFQGFAAEYVADAERRRAIALLDACDLRGVPEEPGLRSAITRPRNTPALGIVRASLGWRDKQPIWRGARQPVVAILSGTPGDGKSSAIASAVAHHEGTATFALARTIGTTPRNGFSTNQALLEKWSRVDLLAVDELGHEDSPDGSERIAALIAERYDRGRATLCATNLSIDEFVTRYLNARLESRLNRGQFKGGAPNGWPYFHRVPDLDLRDPANLATLEVEGTP